MVRYPGSTAQEIGDRYAPALAKGHRLLAAHHELTALARAGLVQVHRKQWSPSIMAIEVLARADRPRPPKARMAPLFALMERKAAA